MKSITQKKSTSTKTANRAPNQKPQQKARGLVTCTGTRAGVSMGSL